VLRTLLADDGLAGNAKYRHATCDRLISFCHPEKGTRKGTNIQAQAMFVRPAGMEATTGGVDQLYFVIARPTKSKTA
jgi:hypothetical protein